MATDSVSGVNIKIGADLSELQKEVSKVGSTIEGSITPGQAKPVKDLAKDFKDVKDEARLSKINIAAVASAVTRIGSALAGLTKGILEEAVKTNPETAQTVEDLKNSFNGIKAAIVEGVAPLIEKYGPQLTTLFDSIAQWITEHPQLTSAIMGFAGAIGLLAPAISTVLPFLTLFNISLAPISGTALLVVGGIAALVAVIALLSSGIHDSSAGLREFNGDMENIEPTIESVVEVAGQSFLQDKFQHAEGAIDINGRILTAEDWVQWDDRQMGWIPATEEELALLNARLAETSELSAGATENLTGEAVTEEVTGTLDEATSAADQAQKIYDDLVKSTGKLSETTVSSTDDINASIQSANELLSSETFQQFAQVPIDESVSSSWSTFGDSVSTAADSFSDLTGELDKNSISGQLSDIGNAADTATVPVSNMAAAVFSLAEAIKELNKAGPLKLPKLGSGGGNGGSTDLFKASGGPVRAGSPYIVGEAGPELFVPRYTGNIIPNDEISTQPAINVNIGNVYGESYLKDYVVRLMTGQIRKELRLAS